MHWLLAILFGVAATGLFAACATILCVLNPIVLGLNNVLMPRVAVAIAAGSASELRRVLWKSTLVVTATTALFCATLLAFGPQIMRLLYGAAYAGQSQTISILAIDMLVSSLAMAPAYALLGTRTFANFVPSAGAADRHRHRFQPLPGNFAGADRRRLWVARQ